LQQSPRSGGPGHIPRARTIRTDSALHRDQSASWDDAQRLVLELVFAQLDQQVTAFAQVRFESRSHRLLMLSAG